jgi:arylformamidase
MDAPAHFVRGGKHIEDLPIDAVVGRARVVAIRSKRRIEPAELEQHGIRRGERVLFKTANSRRCWTTDEFVQDFVHISAAAAEWLAARQVKTVGVDYLSVGGYKVDGRETHLALLGAGIWVIEGLNLSAVRPGPVDMVCLPLKLMGAEGAPARVIVRPRPHRMKPLPE